MVKMNGCAAIDSARPFRFLADKAAVAADFHLENDACYHGKRRIASTASVCTLAKTGVVRPGFPCRIASKSGEYPLVQKLVGQHPKPFNNFKEIGCAPLVLNNLFRIWTRANYSICSSTSDTSTLSSSLCSAS